MKRARAEQLVTDLLMRLATDPQWPLSLVDQVHVFGSFARGALEPHDVDLAVEFTPDEQFKMDFIYDLSRGRNPFAGLKRALTGGSRGLQFQFQELQNLHRDKIATTLLWKRGESLSAALGRLNAIEADPDAGRAVRDYMLPAFEGIDRAVPLPVRQLLCDWSHAGAVQIAQVQLPDRNVRDARARDVIARRWVDTSPLRRAASDAVAYLEAQGAAARAIHLHGEDIDRRETPYFIGFQWRHVTSIHSCLTQWGGQLWLEVPRPATRQLTGLLITVQDRAVLEKRPDRP